MKKQIIELKEFEVSFLGNTRPLVFSNGFKDEEIHAWKCEEDVLTLYFKDDKKYSLTYDPENVRFEGDFHTGKIIVSPVRNFVSRFQELVEKPRPEKPKQKEKKIQKQGDYAILSKLNLGDKDVYKPRGRLTPIVKELFVKDYKWVVIVQNGTKEELDFFIKNLDENTVNYLHDGYKKDWMIAISKKTFDSFGEFAPLQNFITNLKTKLEKSRKTPKIVKETIKNAKETS